MVLFDRYPVDATLPAARHAPAGRRAVRWLIGHTVPEPDLMIVLDAPAEVLVERKHEQPVDVLETRRLQYLELARRRPDTVVLDATADPDDLRRHATRVIWSACRRRSRSVRGASPQP
jgi:thymidylate kinase